MRKAMIYLLSGFVVMLIVLYLLGWYDLVQNNNLKDNYFENIKLSFKDYFRAINYFKYIILIGSVILALVFYGARLGIEKFRK